MNPQEAKHTFEKQIAAAHLQPKELTPKQGVALMLSFYSNVMADGCDYSHDGDMLLFQWGTHDWGDGEFFDVDITRQLIASDQQDEEVFQLSLTFRFSPTIENIKFGSGTKWCHSPSGLSAFEQFIFASDAYTAAAKETPDNVTLNFQCAG